MRFTRRDSSGRRQRVHPRLCGAALSLATSRSRRARRSRNLVVLYLGGGNDSLSMLVPYRDPFYTAGARRLPCPPARCCRSAATAAGNELGLHPRLTGLKTIFNEGRLALIQRTGYENSSRSHFDGTDIWSTANPRELTGPGWLGRYLDTIPSPVDPLDAWNTTREVPHRAARGWSACRRSAIRRLRVPESERRPPRRIRARRGDDGCRRICRSSPAPGVRQRERPGGVRDARSRGDGRRLRRQVTYPANGFAQALRAVAGALATQIGTNVLGADGRIRYARGAGEAAPTGT